MGNCLAHESRRPKSRSQFAVVPLSHVDEPEKKQVPRVAHKPSKRDKAAPRSKRSVGFANDDDGKEPVRVKVVMTKEEAARLLSMFANSNKSALESMLCDLEGAKGGGCSPNRGRDCWRPVLETIPEIC